MPKARAYCFRADWSTRVEAENESDAKVKAQDLLAEQVATELPHLERTPCRRRRP